ncbi:hypothetical protein V8C44DRAFT_353745 [Trichoderma aethiopicum]
MMQRYPRIMRSEELLRLDIQPNDGQLDTTRRYGAPEAHTHNNRHRVGGTVLCHLGWWKPLFPGWRLSRRGCSMGQWKRLVVLFFSLYYLCQRAGRGTILFVRCELGFIALGYYKRTLGYAGRLGLGSYWVGSSSICYYSTMRQYRY